MAGKAYLVTSSETAFSLDFCLEMTLHCVHNNATFQGLENVYNQLHNYNRQNITRVNLNRKRLATAFFLYSFLEFTTRNGILHEFSCGDSWLDNTILTQISLQVHVQIHTDTFVEHCSYCEKNFKNINFFYYNLYFSTFLPPPMTGCQLAGKETAIAINGVHVGDRVKVQVQVFLL